MSSKECKNKFSRSRKPERIKLAIFDNDGTLTKSAIPDYWLPAALLTIANTQNEFPDILEPCDPAKIGHILSHNPMRIVDYLKAEHRTDEQIQKYANRYRQTAIDLLLARPPKEGPNVRNQLLRLKDEGMKIAIATSAIRPWIDAIIELFEIQDIIDSVQSQSDLPKKPNGEIDISYLKPHPQQLNVIMEELHVEPRYTSMVGDTSSDWFAAQRAGVSTNIALYYPENKASNPHSKIRDFQAQNGSLTGVTFSLRHAVSAILARRV